VDKLNLIVTSPKGVLLDETVGSVKLKSSDGYFGVLPGALHTIALIVESDVVYEKGGGSFSFPVKGGFAEVKDGTVTVITE